MERIYYSLKSYNTFIDLDGKVTREEKIVDMAIPYTEENLAVAKETAIDGKYEIKDDGQEEPGVSLTLEDRVYALESDSAEAKEALELLLSGVTE